jgi:hypothetical protein
MFGVLKDTFGFPWFGRHLNICLLYSGNGFFGDMMINGYHFIMSIYGGIIGREKR